MTQEDLIKANASLKMIEGALRRAMINYIPEREIINIEALCNILDEITRDNDKAINMRYDDQEIDLISRLLRNEGSGFEAQIGEALSVADAANAKRILQAFPALYEKYSKRIEDYEHDDAGLWKATHLDEDEKTLYQPLEDISESDAAKNAVAVDSRLYHTEITARGRGGADKISVVFLDTAVWIHVLGDDGNRASVPLRRGVAHEFFKQITA